MTLTRIKTMANLSTFRKVANEGRLAGAGNSHHSNKIALGLPNIIIEAISL